MTDEPSIQLVNRSIEAISRIGTLSDEIAKAHRAIQALEAQNKDMAEIIAIMWEIIESR